jgi:hypothetical protein
MLLTEGFLGWWEVKTQGFIKPLALGRMDGFAEWVDGV